MSDVDTAPEVKLIERTWRWHFSDTAVAAGSASYDASKPCLSQDVICHIVSSGPSMVTIPAITPSVTFNSWHVPSGCVQVIVTCSGKSNLFAGSFDSSTHIPATLRHWSSPVIS